MKIEELHIGQKVVVTSNFCNGPATIVGLALEGLTSPVYAKIGDPTELFMKKATERITVITPDGRAFTSLKAEQLAEV